MSELDLVLAALDAAAPELFGEPSSPEAIAVARCVVGRVTVAFLRALPPRLRLPGDAGLLHSFAPRALADAVENATSGLGVRIGAATSKQLKFGDSNVPMDAWQRVSALIEDHCDVSYITAQMVAGEIITFLKSASLLQGTRYE